MNRDQCAEILYETDREIRECYGDHSRPRWDRATDDQRRFFYELLRLLLFVRNRRPDEIHEIWMASQKTRGWYYGEVYSVAGGTDPDMVPYTDLSPQNKLRYHAFTGLARAILKFEDKDWKVDNPLRDLAKIIKRELEQIEQREGT